MAINDRTLILIKPDGIQRLLVGEVISSLEKKGLKIVGMKMIHVDKALAKEHYSHLVSKPFYPDLEKFITSYPVVAMVVEGKEAVDVVRLLCGPTNATKAEGGTIRGDFSNSTSRNIIHASDTEESAEKEIKRFFKSSELFDYKLVAQDFLYASDE